MGPTFSEQQELAKQCADHVARMRSCFQTVGRHVSNDDLVRAWAQYSEEVCAGWLMPPDDDPALLEILLKHLPPRTHTQTNVWRTTIIDARDGSSDSI